MSRILIISGIISLLLGTLCAALQDNVRDNKSQRLVLIKLMLAAAWFDALAIILIIIGIISMALNA